MRQSSSAREGELSDLTRRAFLGRTSSAGLTIVVGSGFLAACGELGRELGLGRRRQGGGKLTGPIASQQAIPAGVVFQQLDAAAKEVGKQLKLDVKILNYDADNDRALSQIDQMGTQGVKAVTTLILDNGITRQIAEDCVRNELFLSTWAQVGLWVVPSEPEIDYHYQCLANPPDGAYVTCKNMFEELGGKGTFAHITGAAGSATSRAKDKAIDKALSEYPGIEMVARQRGDYDREKSRQVLGNILAKTGNKLDAVFCQSDDSGVGALDALREVNLVGKTLVGGADGIPEFIDAIIKGEAFGTEGVVPFLGGGYTLMQALDASAGHKPNPGETLMRAGHDHGRHQGVGARSTRSRSTPTAGPEALRLREDVADPAPRRLGPAVAAQDVRARRVLGDEPGRPEARRATSCPTTTSRPSRATAAPKVDKTYKDHLKSFPLEEAARKSRTGKTLFEQIDS